MLTLSIATLHRYSACDLDRRIADLRRVLPSVTETDEIPLRAWWDLPSTSTADRWWSLRLLASMGADPAEAVLVAAGRAAVRRALPLTRKRDRGVFTSLVEAATADAGLRADALARANDAFGEPAAFFAGMAAAFFHEHGAPRYAVQAQEATGDDDVFAAQSAVAVELAAQRADLDRLLAEVSPC